jgi:excisionase family DNA binding protein
VGRRIEKKDFYTVKEAAGYLGVSPNTLRNWDITGKFKAKRHPINLYRIYSKTALEKLKTKIGKGI